MKRHPTASSRAGFTLVELLTVIGIIALLIAILVPAVNQVRISARNTVSQATISSISTGLETFRADRQLGGQYPPSASDREKGSDLNYKVANPYTEIPGASPPDAIRISGAGLLVWGLAGADLLGTPGFRPVRDSTKNKSRKWSADTDAEFKKKGNSGAYALDPDTREPVYARVAPFVDLTNVKVTRFIENTRSFEIPGEVKARRTMGQPDADQPQRFYPVFLDAFDGPILYWRADRTGTRIADYTPTDNKVSGKNIRDRGVYHFADNAHLLDNGQKSLWLSTARNLFGSDDPHDLLLDKSRVPVESDPKKLRTSKRKGDSFPRFIQNNDVNARSEPQNPKSYLLLSAGRDGIFGTSDDISNFSPSGG